MTESLRTIAIAAPGTSNVLSAALTYASKPGYGSRDDCAEAGAAATDAAATSASVERGRIMATPWQDERRCCRDRQDACARSPRWNRPTKLRERNRPKNTATPLKNE